MVLTRVNRSSYKCTEANLSRLSNECFELFDERGQAPFVGQHCGLRDRNGAAGNLLPATNYLSADPSMIGALASWDERMDRTTNFGSIEQL